MTPRRQGVLGLGAPDTLAGPALQGPAGGGHRLALDRFRWPFRSPERVPDLDRPSVPPPLGRRGDLPLDLGLIVDDSGSMGWNDPEAWRYVALRRIVNLLVEGVDGERVDDRVAVVHFSEVAVPWMPLTPVRSRAGRTHLRGFLRPLTGGGTAIVLAIERMAHLLGRGLERAAVVLLFTDGESGETSSELIRSVSLLPLGALHVIVLGDELPDQWKDVPVASATAMGDLQQPADIEWLMARALYRGLSLEWSGPDRPPAPSRARR